MHEMRLIKKDGGEIPASMEDKVIDRYRKYNEAKRKYIEIQNEQLYEKWEINYRRGRKETTRNILVAYVTFKSMIGKDIAKKIFEYAEENAKADTSENEKMFCEKFLKVGNTVAMSGIIWANIGIHRYSFWARKIIIWGVAVLIIFIALILMVTFQNYSTELLAAAP
jgi:hypothetical protein